MKMRGALKALFGMYLLATIGHLCGAQVALNYAPGTSLRTNWNGVGDVLGHDQFDQEVCANVICVENPGFSQFFYQTMVQVDPLNGGQSTYFDSNNSFASWSANSLVGYSWNDIRQGASVCSGAAGSATGIQGNNLGTQSLSTKPLTATISGGGVNSVSIVTASQPGMPNGTYFSLLNGGGSTSAASISFTITGASFSAGVGYTGGSITSTSIVSAGTGYSSAPTINIAPMIFTPTCSASGGYSVLDYVFVTNNELVTPQSEWQYLGWATSTSGGATITGETDLLSNVGLPAGSTNTQALELNTTSGSASISTSFETGNGFGGQNHINFTGPMDFQATAYTRTGTGTLGVTVKGVLAYSPFTTIWTCSGSMSLTTTPTVFHPLSACNPNETTSTGIRTVQVSIAVSGNSDSIIDSVCLLDTAFDSDCSDFRKSVKDNHKNNGMSVRLLDFNQKNHPVLQMLQPDVRTVNPAISSLGCNNQALPFPLYQCADGPSLTLPMMTKVRDYIGNGKDLHFVLPPSTNMLDTTEAKCYADWMGDLTNATTCGALRNTQGRAPPVTQLAAEGAQAHFSDANENWNGNTGSKWSIVQAGGTNGYAPYGYSAQSIFSSWKAQASYSSATEDMVIGLQNSGSNTLFFTDVILAAGTGICTACDTIEIAPYWIGFGVTSAGFDSNTPVSQQLASALAEMQYDNDLSGGSPYIIAHATSAFPGTCGSHCYPVKMLNYEFNGGLTFQAATGIPTQPQLNGFQNGLLAGLINAITALESCSSLGNCRSFFFTYENFNQTFTNGATTTFTGDTVSGSNVVSNVSSTANLNIGQSVNLKVSGTTVISGSVIGPIPFIPGVTTTLNIGGGNPTATSTNTGASGTATNLSSPLWGGWLGSGAQINNNMRASLVPIPAINAVVPAGSTMVQTTYTPGVWSWPPSGTCPTACNGIPASTTVPKMWAYGFKKGSTFQAIIICVDPSGASCPVTISGTGLSGTVTQTLVTSTNPTDNNENPTAVVTASNSSVTMPSSYTAPPFSMTIFSGTTGATPGKALLQGNVKLIGGKYQ